MLKKDYHKDATRPHKWATILVIDEDKSGEKGEQAMYRLNSKLEKPSNALSVLPKSQIYIEI